MRAKAEPNLNPREAEILRRARLQVRVWLSRWRFTGLFPWAHIDNTGRR